MQTQYAQNVPGKSRGGSSPSTRTMIEVEVPMPDLGRPGLFDGKIPVYEWEFLADCRAAHRLWCEFRGEPRELTNSTVSMALFWASRNGLIKPTWAVCCLDAWSRTHRDNWKRSE